MLKIYNELKFGWKILLWELGILFAVVITGLINLDNPFDEWAIEDILVLFFLFFITWWAIVFVTFWIIDGFRHG